MSNEVFSVRQCIQATGHTPRPKVATVKDYLVEIESEGQPYHWTGKAQHAARAAMLALLAMKRQHPECQRKATMVAVYEL